MSGCRLGFGTNAGFGATITVCGIHQFAVVNVREPGVVVVIAVTSCASGSMLTVTVTSSCQLVLSNVSVRAVAFQRDPAEDASRTRRGSALPSVTFTVWPAATGAPSLTV